MTKIAAAGGDPDVNVVKTLDLRYRIDGKEKHLVLHDGDMVDFSEYLPAPPAAVEAGAKGRIQLCVAAPGHYQAILGSGETATMAIPEVPDPMPIQGPWTVEFPAGWGAPSRIQLEDLIPLNDHSDAGVRYFSGTASYHCEFELPDGMLERDHRLELDLGTVAVMAEVKLNGRPLGILWRAPFRVDATAALRAGRNTLEIAVANLWVNRLIGDQQLPPDADRAPDGHLNRWPQWLLDGRSSPTGRFTFTTWELWRRDDPLVESGLIGPVKLRTMVCKPLGV